MVGLDDAQSWRGRHRLASLARDRYAPAMASARKTVDYIVDQTSGAGDVAAKPMFGEYGLYCDGKMVAIVADDQLYVKPTAAGRAACPNTPERPPYPGAKPYLWIDAERWEDAEWLASLVRATAAELPAPKPKPTKRP